MIEVLEVDPPYDDYPPTLLRAQMQSAARYRQSGSKTPASIRYPLGQMTVSSLFEKQKMIMEVAAFILAWRKTYLAQFPQYSAYKVDDLVAQKMIEEDAHKVPPEIIEAAWKQVGGRRIAPEPPAPEPWSITKKAVVYGGIGLAVVLVLRSFGKRAGHMAGLTPDQLRFIRCMEACDPEAVTAALGVGLPGEPSVLAADMKRRMDACRRRCK